MHVLLLCVPAVFPGVLSEFVCPNAMCVNLSL